MEPKPTIGKDASDSESLPSHEVQLSDQSFDLLPLVVDTPISVGRAQLPQAVQTVGGMRNTIKSMGATPPWARTVGASIFTFFAKYLSKNPSLESAIHSSIAAGDSHLIEGDLEQTRQAFMKFTGASSIDPVDNGVCQTPIRASLLDRWAGLAGDCGRPVVKWLWEGAPAGILAFPSEVDKVFPRADDRPGSAEYLDPTELFDDDGTHSDYHTFDIDAEAADEIHSLANKGYLKPFSSLEEAEEYLGGKAPPVSPPTLVASRLHGVRPCGSYAVWPQQNSVMLLWSVGG